MADGRDARGHFVKGHRLTQQNGGGRPSGKVGIEALLGGAFREAWGKLSECEVRERFRILNEAYHWFDVILSQDGFPDFALRDKNGGIIRAEVETESKHFVAHRHDPAECDLIICWRHNWRDCPLPVLTLSAEWVNYHQLHRVTPCIPGDTFGE